MQNYVLGFSERFKLPCINLLAQVTLNRAFTAVREILFSIV